MVSKELVLSLASQCGAISSAVEFAKQGASGLILHYLGDEITTEEIKVLKKDLEEKGVQTVIIPGDIALLNTSKEVSVITHLNPFELTPSSAQDSGGRCEGVWTHRRPRIECRNLSLLRLPDDAYRDLGTDTSSES